jgi:MYXO-CTERM domain-containing protein
MFRTALVSMTALAATLVATDAQAETATAPFAPELTERVAEFPWDSGYVPATGPLRIKLEALARQDVTIEMDGDAAYDWESNALSFHGHTGAGNFANELGAEITATIAIDVFGFQTEFEVGIWEIAREVNDTFTPYVLAGNIDHPITLAQLIGPYNLVNQPFSVGPATGTLVIDWQLDVPGMTFRGTRIDIANDDSAPPVASVVEEHQEVSVTLPNAEPGGVARTWGTQYGAFDSEVALHVMPLVNLEIYGIPFTIGPFDMKIAYPHITDRELAFEQLPIDLGVPLAPPEDDDDGGGDSGDDGDSDSDGDDDDDDDGDDREPDPDGDSDGSGDAGDSDGDSGGAAESSGGCGCTTGSDPVPNALASGLLGLALVSLRRRRR